MQFFVYQNTNAASQVAFPLLLDVQSNLLDDLRSVVVIPLSRRQKSSADTQLHGRSVAVDNAFVGARARISDRPCGMVAVSR